MAPAVRRAHSKPLISAFIFAAFLAFCPHAVLRPAQTWFNTALSASDSNDTLSVPIAWCSDDDYKYIKVRTKDERRTSVNSLSHNVHFDATGSSWERDSPSIIIKVMNKICWNGGVVSGDPNRNVPTEIRSAERPFAAAMQILGYNRNAQVLIHETGFINLEHALEIQGVVKVLNITDSLFQHISGNCVAGSIYKTWSIENSLLDGCGSIVQDSVFQGGNGREQVLTIRDNLIRVDTDRRSARARESGNGTRARTTGNLTLEVHGNIFLVEDDDAEAFFEGLRKGILTRCSDNIVVWLGAGRYPDWLPSCFSITNDESVWAQAVASWINEHDFVAQIQQRAGTVVGGMSHRWHPESSARLEIEADEQRSLESGGRGDQEIAGLEPSTPETLTTSRRRRAKVGSPWSDATLWSDGTGWADFAPGSLVSCRESRAGVTVCSP